ncbi:uncharacterized protein JCM6883_005342 [Sporobolomyces salmoneus]|uniref:uncharacterized protein n=1 Tax=Sporobolomyces salmoneus TaxID=183962 RepID=UPI00317EC405
MDPPSIASSSTASAPVPTPSAIANSSHHQPLHSARQDYSAYLLEPTNVHPSPLSGTLDLITLFNLDPLYNTFLRPYLPPSALGHSTNSNGSGNAGPGAVNADSPIPLKGAVSLKGKERERIQPSPVPSPAYAVASPAPGGGTAAGGGGFKITLGGIKLTSSSINAAPNATTTTGSGKVKKVRMEKQYSHMIQDILGRNSIKKDTFLTHLVMNPDPVPCPPLHPPDGRLLRDGLTLKPGGLAGFDMGLWENGPAEGEGAEKKKKKKRKQQDGGTGQGESDRKKQKQ